MSAIRLRVRVRMVCRYCGEAVRHDHPDYAPRWEHVNSSADAACPSWEPCGTHECECGGDLIVTPEAWGDRTECADCGASDFRSLGD